MIPGRYQQVPEPRPRDDSSDLKSRPIKDPPSCIKSIESEGCRLLRCPPLKMGDPAKSTSVCRISSHHSSWHLTTVGDTCEQDEAESTSGSPAHTACFRCEEKHYLQGTDVRATLYKVRRSISDFHSKIARLARCLRPSAVGHQLTR